MDKETEQKRCSLCKNLIESVGAGDNYCPIVKEFILEPDNDYCSEYKLKTQPQGQQ